MAMACKYVYWDIARNYPTSMGSNSKRCDWVTTTMDVISKRMLYQNLHTYSGNVFAVYMNTRAIDIAHVDTQEREVYQDT